MAFLGYLLKLKMGLGIASGAHFLHDFPIKCSSFNSLSLDKVSMSCLFYFLRYQTKCVIKFLFRPLMTSQPLRFIFHQPLKQWLTGRKWREDRNKNFEYLKNNKSFLDEIKSIFHSFWRAIIWWQIKIWWKIADTSFKNNFPGPDWLQGFIKHHRLTKRITENVKASRAEVNEDIINNYFNHLEETLEDVPAFNLFNYDKTNVTDNPGSK